MLPQPNQLPIDTSSTGLQTDLEQARWKMMELEKSMLGVIESGEFLDAKPLTKLVHHFIPKGYARQMWVPKGTLLTGAIHRNACFNVVLEGELEVINGLERTIVTAPAFFISPAGSKRAMYARQDSTWITIHPVQDSSIGVDELEAELTCSSFAELEKDSK